MEKPIKIASSILTVSIFQFIRLELFFTYITTSVSAVCVWIAYIIVPHVIDDQTNRPRKAAI